ncbi:hypothetical protein AB0E69_10445 [Kribbella sp. NPDC026611]|uniref:iron chaperone n=1 Tax=Kribbella sp. NPDC026611 TaxID=3154911 RepID=UPI0033DA4456
MTPQSYDGFTAAERGAMKERAKELKATAEGDAAVREKIAELDGPDRATAERLHEVVLAAAPQLTPRLYYGMPAWGSDGRVVCFFQPAAKFKARYPTFGFQDVAQLDDGAIWPVSFAVSELTPAVEQQIAELVRKAVSA